MGGKVIEGAAPTIAWKGQTIAMITRQALDRDADGVGLRLGTEHGGLIEAFYDPRVGLLILVCGACGVPFGAIRVAPDA